MSGQNAHEAARQNIGPLTLLACMHWYITVLFSSVSHLKSDQRKYFNAVCGMDHYSIDPYTSGQLTFTMANLWSHSGECPSVMQDVTLSPPDIRNYFKVFDQRVLSNLISGRDRSFRQGGTHVPFPSMDWLVLSISMSSNHLITVITQKFGHHLLFDDMDEVLGGRGMEEVVEIIFITMTRAIWNRLPSQRINGREVANLAEGNSVEDVRKTWAVAQFRQQPRQLRRLFRDATIIEKTGPMDMGPWNRLFSLLFGNMSDGWFPNSSSQGVQSLGHYVKWKAVMESLQSDISLQRTIYNLMEAKFKTLLAFPQIKANGSWQTKKSGQGDRYHVQLLRNPHLMHVTADALRKAGYHAIVDTTTV